MPESHIRKFRVLFVIPALLFLSAEICFAEAGIIVALNSTLEQIKKDMKTERISRKSKRVFYSGEINGINTVLVRSPMGKVHNAVTTQALLSSHPVEYIISIAPAGAVGNNIHIGDAIVARKVYQHDFGTIKPYGFIWGRVPDGTGRDEPGYNTADIRLMKTVLYHGGIFQKTNRITGGIIVSGDQYISSLAKTEWLRKKFEASAVDMGAAAIAQTCHANGIPYCIIRIITDKSTVNARSDFEKSVFAYQSDINIPEFLKKIIQN